MVVCFELLSSTKSSREKTTEFLQKSLNFEMFERVREKFKDLNNFELRMNYLEG